MRKPKEKTYWMVKDPIGFHVSNLYSTKKNLLEVYSNKYLKITKSRIVKVKLVEV